MASEQLVATVGATDQNQMMLLGLVVMLALHLILAFQLQFLLLVLVVHLILVVLILVVLVVVPFLLRALGLDPHPSFYAICDDFSF
jgi:RsiW-degrading membrane proteinase PrsW (M82 family)